MTTLMYRKVLTSFCWNTTLSISLSFFRKSSSLVVNADKEMGNFLTCVIRLLVFKKLCMSCVWAVYNYTLYNSLVLSDLFHIHSVPEKVKSLLYLGHMIVPSINFYITWDYIWFAYNTYYSQLPSWLSPKNTVWLKGY